MMIRDGSTRLSEHHRAGWLWPSRSCLGTSVQRWSPFFLETAER